MSGHQGFRSAWPSALLVIASVCWGCSGQRPADQAVKEQLAEIKGKEVQVAKFSGTVTIDGTPPVVPAKVSLVLILYSAQGTEQSHETIYRTVVDKEGHFEFTRYTKGDGVPPGSYTVLFDELVPRRGSQFSGPDRLKNRYNDPDTSPFHVEVTSSGKTDWVFNLEIAGKDPVATPGPHAVTQLINR
jgi:hypothetical protein